MESSSSEWFSASESVTRPISIHQGERDGIYRWDSVVTIVQSGLNVWVFLVVSYFKINKSSFGLVAEIGTFYENWTVLD